MAGYDTIRSAITATTYLFRHGDCHGRCQNGSRDRFPKLKDIYSGEQLQQCQYLHASITEAMRFSPGVGGILLREVLQSGMTIDGHFLPLGTDSGVANDAIHLPTHALTSCMEHEGRATAREIQLANSGTPPSLSVEPTT